MISESELFRIQTHAFCLNFGINRGFRSLNVPPSFFSDASSRHPLLELNLQRPVYRNYRLLMNGTLYIHKVRTTISFINSLPVIFYVFDFLSYLFPVPGRGGRRGAVPLRGGERRQRSPRRRRQPQGQR